MSDGVCGEAVVRWDVEGQSRIAVAARGDRADSFWRGMCVRVASVMGDADVVC